ncbi:hypothetical protein [Haladaptatus salinisoli]|uniref:hypothetical protein n=1 Tax=Haladaptatus salinisoli TaxID=2884876 RepID=UPI001D0A7DFD|nr:hypothetical protein [Haladaptatus salinisoli]
MLRRTRRRRESLARCYDSTIVSPPPRVGVDDLKATVTARSPIHFERGDMRRDYGRTRALLTAAAVVGSLALSVRVLLTGLFVVFVSTDLLLVGLFNACVTVLVGRWVLVSGTAPRTLPRRARRLVRNRRVPPRIRRLRPKRSSASVDRL